MNPENRIGLVHAYGNDPDRIDKPDMRGRMTALATGELLRQGILDTVVITAGTPDMTGVELGGNLARQIRRNVPWLREDAIIVSPVARDTIGEIQEYHSIITATPESEKFDIATETHIPRIRTELKREFGKEATEITIFSVEDVLQNRTRYPTNRYNTVLHTLATSDDEIGFQRREKYLLRPLSRLPFGHHVLGLIRRLPNKGELLGGATALFAGKLPHAKKN